MRTSYFALIFSLLILLIGTGPADGRVRTVKLEGGASNHNYLVETSQGPFFMRRSNQGAETLENEWRCTQLAAKALIAPEVIAYYPDKQILITDFIQGAEPVDLSIELPQVVEKIKELHQLPEAFPHAISPFRLAHSLYDQAQAARVYLPLEMHQLMKTLGDLPYTPAPCHLDLHHGNLLSDGKRLWIIDWEYAAESDPLFDLAVLASTEDFSEEKMRELLKLYGSDDWEHLLQMRVIADIRWALWCFLQEERSTLLYPYRQEGEKFFSAAKRFSSMRLSHSGKK